MDVLRQSDIGEKMRNKMDIDMIMYNVSYSPTSSDVY